MWTNKANKLILASASPRRLELLKQIAVPVEQLVVPAVQSVSSDGDDEPRLPGETVTDYVMRTAHDKNQRARAHCHTNDADQDVPILSADTTVAMDQTILGKPTDDADAKRILTALAGQTHDVYTAVVLSTSGVDGQTHSALVHTRVTIDAALHDCIDAYITTGEPKGKAGAYAIQGIAAAYVTEVTGSYSSVVGLPLYETAQLLRQAGLYS